MTEIIEFKTEGKNMFGEKTSIIQLTYDMDNDIYEFRKSDYGGGYDVLFSGNLENLKQVFSRAMEIWR